MKLLAVLALGATMLATPLAAPADTAMAPAMAPMKVSPTDATLLCRPAAASEKPNAMLGERGLVCKSLAKMMKNGMMMVPDTKSDADKAWDGWLSHALDIPMGFGGTG